MATPSGCKYQTTSTSQRTCGSNECNDILTQKFFKKKKKQLFLDTENSENLPLWIKPST